MSKSLLILAALRRYASSSYSGLVISPPAASNSSMLSKTPSSYERPIALLSSIQHMRSLLHAGSSQLSILFPPTPPGNRLPSSSELLVVSGAMYEGSISSSVASAGGKWSARGCHSVKIIRLSTVPRVRRLPFRSPLQGAVLDVCASVGSAPDPQNPPPKASWPHRHRSIIPRR